jgi:hypothetical protein
MVRVGIRGRDGIARQETREELRVRLVLFVTTSLLEELIGVPQELR